MGRLCGREHRLRIALLVLSVIGALVIPPLVNQVSDFINAVPDFIDDLTAVAGRSGGSRTTTRSSIASARRSRSKAQAACSG